MWREMCLVFGLLIMLAVAPQGHESVCQVKQDAVCYGAVGEPVYLQLPADPQELAFYKSQLLFKLKKGRKQSISQQWQFIDVNRTLLVKSAEKSDSGTYRTEIFDNAGVETENLKMYIFIEAPVSSVNLSISCLSSGERKVTCSTNGDSHHYTWTLDGSPLREAPHNNYTLLLNGMVTGLLSCNVANNVSSGQSKLQMTTCQGTTAVTPKEGLSHLTTPATKTALPSGDTNHKLLKWIQSHILIVSVSAGVFLLCVVMSVVLCCRCRRRRKADVDEDYQLN
ncbi:uncharacterized protein LOC114768226 [Denticeps clupeoides]|uniref:uncharacterized protein LOC114768226 n=1 Tax=Denticeps clupeoides TaxID=299321 RepID=UPI0010A367E7|nr:uncharacterized protein LOC114768226 [Denticeps clupeoides]